MSLDLLTLKTLGPAAFRGSAYKWTPSGPVLREPPKTETKSSPASRAMNIEDVRNIVSSFTSRPQARALIKAAPRTLAILKENGDLDRIIDGKAPVIEDSIHLLESGKEGMNRRKAVAISGIGRGTVFSTGVQPHHQFLTEYTVGVHDEMDTKMREELTALNKELGFTIGWFIVKSRSKKKIRLVKPEENFPNEHIIGTTRFLHFFGYKGDVSEADKNLLREVKALL
jgi:hypothetical protein